MAQRLLMTNAQDLSDNVSRGRVAFSLRSQGEPGPMCFAARHAPVGRELVRAVGTSAY